MATDKASPSVKKKPPLYGIISIVIGLFAGINIKLFFLLLVMIQVIFIVIGYIKDQSKWASTISVIIAVSMLFLYAEDEIGFLPNAKMDELIERKDIELKAFCDGDCKITYSYSIVESTEEAQYRWNTKFNVGNTERIRFAVSGAKSLMVIVDGEITQIMAVYGEKTAFMSGSANAGYNEWSRSEDLSIK